MSDSLYTLDPAVVAELDALPAQPVLLYALDGHIDSGMVAGLVISDLIEDGQAKRLATFDTDQLINYRSRRPPMVCGQDGWAAYGRPELVIGVVEDMSGTPFLVLYGPEPDLKWEAFAQSVLEIVELLDVRLALGIHGNARMVPHTRPPAVHGPAHIEESDAQYLGIDARLHAPGSAMSMVEFHLRKVERPAQTLLADVPTYLAGVPYARAAVAMVEAINEASGLQLATERLTEAAMLSDERLESEVTRVGGDLSRTVKELEQRFDKLHSTRSAPPQAAASQLVKDIEAYLAEQPSSSTEG